MECKVAPRSQLPHSADGHLCLNECGGNAALIVRRNFHINTSSCRTMQFADRLKFGARTHTHTRAREHTQNMFRTFAIRRHASESTCDNNRITMTVSRVCNTWGKVKKVTIRRQTGRILRHAAVRNKKHKLESPPKKRPSFAADQICGKRQQ
jgi:hypothetical protein